MDNRTRQRLRERDEAEARMAELQQQKTEWEAVLAGQPTLAQINTLGTQLQTLQAELDTLEERWLELTSQIES